jgi:tetratricopeptide (TPR) repeat protein
MANEPWILDDAATREALVARMNNVALVAKEAGLGKEALAIWEWLLFIDDRSKEVLLNLAAYSDETNNAEKAAEFFQRATALYPDDAFVHLQTGIHHVRHERDEEALREFRLTVKLDRLNQQARYNAAVLLYKAGKTQQAKEQLRRLLRVNPSHTKAKNFLEQISR